MGFASTRRRRAHRLLLALLIMSGGWVLPGVGPYQAADASPRARGCGPLDKPETGIQGDVPKVDQVSGRSAKGYNCGLALVGYSSLGDRGANVNMAWAGACAYVSGLGNGIAVVDAVDPRNPVHVGTLHGEGSDFTVETMHALQVGDRSVLVAGRYGLLPTPGGSPMDIYDVSDCARPKKMSTFTFPSNIHNLTISPDGRRVYTSLPVQALDITDLRRPRFLGNLDNQISMPVVTDDFGKELAHEVEVSADGNTLYLGGQTPMFSYFTIVDVTNWPARKPTILSQVTGRGHGVSVANIGGQPFLVHSEESVIDPLAKGCFPRAWNPAAGAAQPWLSDISDPAHPKMKVSQLTLEINRPKNCAAEMASGVNASVHYHEVDDPERTTFAMLSMWNAGLRVFDVRDPLRPREAGYFNPGTFDGRLDKAWGHPRYVPETGHIWFATETGGFWIVELEPQVRAALGLPQRPAVNPDGGPARPAATNRRVAGRADTARYFCTLAK